MRFGKSKSELRVTRQETCTQTHLQIRTPGGQSKDQGCSSRLGGRSLFYAGANLGSGINPTSLILAGANRRPRRWSGSPFRSPNYRRLHPLPFIGSGFLIRVCGTFNKFGYAFSAALKAQSNTIDSLLTSEL